MDIILSVQYWQSLTVGSHIIQDVGAELPAHSGVETAEASGKDVRWTNELVLGPSFCLFKIYTFR